jgi:hypothetical protein
MGGHAPEPLPVEFTRLVEQGYKRDPLCRRKIAIARKLLEQELWETDVFVPGVRHVQKEPAFGGPVDTAAELRAICGVAFAQLGRSDALDVLGELLADPERIARVGAARGLGDAGRPDASALLRYKILEGDEEPEVIAACLESLLHLGDALDFCVRLLAAHDDRSEAAALALAGRRDPLALEPLRAWSDSALAEQRRRVGYVALALLRAEAATEHLLEAVRSGDQIDALAAAKALAIFKDDPAVVAKLRAAAPAKLRAELDDLLGR